MVTLSLVLSVVIVTTVRVVVMVIMIMVVIIDDSDDVDDDSEDDGNGDLRRKDSRTPMRGSLKVSRRVPQGSLLDPLLFLAYGSYLAARLH